MGKESEYQMKLFIYMVVITIILANAVVFFSTWYNDIVHQKNIAECEQRSAENKEAYKNTPFANFDFMQSCMQNITCTSGENNCNSRKYPTKSDEEPHSPTPSVPNFPPNVPERIFIETGEWGSERTYLTKND